MTIIVLTNCPPKLRGDMTKWMAEINTGVYVGKLSARVREELWKRICENVKSGQATMVFPSDGEQRMDFRVHNTTWEIVDFDGIKLMRKPSPEAFEESGKISLESGFSNAAKQKKISIIRRASCKNKNVPLTYIVLDIETTGLNFKNDQIIEIAALKVDNGDITDNFSRLIFVDKLLPDKITGLTGITNVMLQQNGSPLENVLKEFLTFIEDNPVVCHNAAFDINFLQEKLRKCQYKLLKNKVIDTLPLARKKINCLKGYKLADVAEYYEIYSHQLHRALSDCQLTYEIFLRLNQS